MNYSVYGTSEFTAAVTALFDRRSPVIVFAHFENLPTTSDWSLFRSQTECESYFDRFVRDSFRLGSVRRAIEEGDTHAYVSLVAAINQVTFYLACAVDFVDYYNALCTISTSADDLQESLIRLTDDELPLLLELQPQSGDREFIMIDDRDRILGWKLPTDLTVRVFALDQSYNFGDAVSAKRPLLPSDDPLLHRLAKSSVVSSSG
jgi:hypothetical protein